MAYYRCMMSGGSGGFPVTLTVTCDSNYEGETLYLTKGLTVLSEIVPSNLTVSFTFPENGTWVLSNSLNQETETFVNVGEYEYVMASIPDGKTVTPTDDIQTWLNCANIWDKAYTTLGEVLADASTLSALIASNNAVDYMVRSTTWAASITADNTAMSYIGLNNYCANTLLADSTWCEAICNSEYFESVLNVKVPTMTSNTTPSGECSANVEWNSNLAAWKAFDGDDSTSWATGVRTSSWLKYDFGRNVAVHLCKLVIYKDDNYLEIEQYTIKGSVDDANYDIIIPTQQLPQTQGASPYYSHIISGNNKYRYFLIDGMTTWRAWGTGLSTVQFYGRADV